MNFPSSPFLCNTIYGYQIRVTHKVSEFLNVSSSPWIGTQCYHRNHSIKWNGASKTSTTSLRTFRLCLFFGVHNHDPTREDSRCAKMAALLRDWLAHTIEQELKLAIEWHHAQSSDGGGLATQRPSEDLLKQVKVEDDYEAYLASPAQIKPETKYTNDGSNLRVECSRDMTSLRWVQLVKVSCKEARWPL